MYHNVKEVASGNNPKNESGSAAFYYADSSS